MKGFVYLLTSLETGLGYVGSTINLKRRLWRHRSEKYNNCSSKLLGEFTHSILEEYVDDYITDKKEFLILLGWVERKWQDLYWGNLVNELRSQITREEELERDKEYNVNYRAEHSDQLTEKFTCNCGGKYTYKHKTTHIKTKKHQEYLKSL